MQTTQLIAKLLAAGVLSVAILPLSPFLAQAKDESRLAWLFEAQCVSESPGRWRREVEDVSVGREVYRSVMFLGPGSQFASLACRIRQSEDTETSKKKNFQSLKLEFGMRDRHSASPANQVIVYLDGEQASVNTVSSGERVVLALDVSNISNIAIETICSSKIQYCDRVYFFDASLSADVVVPTEETPKEESKKLDNLPPREEITETESPETESPETESPETESPETESPETNTMPSETDIKQPATLPSKIETLPSIN
ncbi:MULTISPECIES: hypothetical protein [Planktothricoides]|uniref:Uncharacterized protein n=2 Tax=Planktothricoides raciborskii TaxID=132608 RepID=A0AAU8JAM1_9CYAN|nr:MULTISPECIES: hypothetical protein [Planktothricoides]MBD2542738.1 hypothetical protein [Planktothricoides raciborskii FACHB-1370]MBD2581515.1 hypothetical protein [Planktothricoides raciborskii FACHB-1261]